MGSGAMKQQTTRVAFKVTYAGQKLAQAVEATSKLAARVQMQAMAQATPEPELAADVTWQQWVMGWLDWQCLDMRVYPVDFSLNKMFTDDIVHLVEAVSLDTTLVRSDQIVLRDDVQIDFKKRVTGDTITLVEHVVVTILVLRNFDETVLLTEHGLLLNQGYFDHTGNPDGYFADDYFGDKRTW